MHVKANDYIQFKIAVHVVNHCTTSLCHVKRGSLKAVPLSTVLEGLRFGISIHPWYRGSWSCLNQVYENTCKTKKEIEWFSVYSVTSCKLQQIYIIVLYIALFSIHVTFVSAARIGSWLKFDIQAHNLNFSIKASAFLLTGPCPLYSLGFDFSLVVPTQNLKLIYELSKEYVPISRKIYREEA